jgi:predicted acylesterase/phospholipase RssA
MGAAQSRFHRWGQARALRWTCVLSGVLALAGCAVTTRRDAPPALFSSATPVDFSADVRFLSTDRASVERKSTIALARLRTSSKDGMLRALVLSGGGAGGAFGAGALVGLSRRQERPQYDVVTGVSAGALIAPFAFLGPEWDSQLTEAFTSGRGEPMSVRGLLGLRFGASRRSAALTALVDRYITPELIKAVAREAGNGRLLWVATTDLDKEETVIWDLGAIAMRGGEPARKLFRDVLVASASIPGVFEPVLIHVQQGGRLYDEMHVDGGVSTSLFVAPVAAYFALLDQRSLGGARLYVLINGQIIAAPETTPLKLGPVVGRTFKTALRHMSRAQVVAIDQFADKYRMSVQSTYLPYDYPTYSSSDFRAAMMRSLFEYGARCAESGRLWTSMDETMTTVAAALPASRRVPAADQQVACPLRDIQLTAGGVR